MGSLRVNRFAPLLNWGITTVFVLIQFFLQTSTGLMAKAWQEDFNLTPTELGYLTAAFYAAYVGMQIPVGVCYDRIGPRRILCGSSIALCIGIFWLAYSQNFWQALAARLLMGFGSAFGFVGMLYVTSAYFSASRFALLIGVSETLGMLGVAFSEVLMGWITAHYGWRIMLLTSGFTMMLLVILIFLFIVNPVKPRLHIKLQGTILQDIKKVMGNKTVWLAGIYGFSMFSIVNVIVALWGVPFLSWRYPDFSLETSSFMMSMILLGTAIGAPLNAWLINYLQKRQMLMAIFSIITTVLLSCVLRIYFSKGVLALILFNMGLFSSTYVQVFTIVKEYVEEKVQATALAAANMILMTSAPLLQPLTGKLLELHFSFPQALSVVEIGLIGSILISFGFDKDLSDKNFKKSDKSV